MSLAESATIIRGQSLPYRRPTKAEVARDTMQTAMVDEKAKKRSLFGLGKKKKSGSPEGSSSPEPASYTHQALSRGASKLSSATRSTSPRSQRDFVMTHPSSPGRGMSASPAGSQIFERDVQDYTLAPASPAIPSHIQTENHIPPVLDASSEAITDGHDPDNVEIVTHSQHQPASVSVTGTANSPHPTYEQTAPWAEEFAAYSDRDDVSNFTPLDSSAADIRRLSFISFADVVLAEHGGAPTNPRDSVHLAGLTSLSDLRRSPSPIRSPVSSQGPGTSPPTSKCGSCKGFDMSPNRKPLGSPTSMQHGIGNGEVNVETMSQALRRTGSADLGGVRSTPVSPI